MGAFIAVVVLLLAAPLLVAVWQRPVRGLLLLAALLPFDGLLLIIPAPTQAVAWKEVVLGVTVLAAVTHHAASPRRVHLPLWGLALGGLMAISLLTAAWSPPLQALVGMKVMFFGMLTAVVVWLCPPDEGERDRLITVLAVTGAITAVVGLAQQLVGHEALHELGYLYNSVIRFTGGFMRSWSTFNQPFPFAFFLMLVVLLAGSRALDDPRRLRNRLILLSLPVLLAGMAVAVVRAAWIGLLAGVIYLAVTRHRGLLAATPVVVGALLVAVVLGAAAFFAPPSVEARFNRWSTIPAVVSEAPLGRGIGTAGAAAARAQILSGDTPTFNPERAAAGAIYQPDNSYLKIVYEVGIIGLGFFVMALVLLFAATRRAAARGDGLAGAAAAVIVAAAVASLASTFFEIFPLDYLFWMVVAIATTHPASGRVAPPDRRAQLVGPSRPKAWLQHDN